MSANQNWEVFNYSCNFTYLGGYRFLDHCGEFLVRAENELQFLPKEDAAPTGASMMWPEEQMECALNADRLEIVQIHPTSGVQTFVETCDAFASLAREVIRPEATAVMACGCASFLRLPSEEAALKASLAFAHSAELDLNLDMSLREAELRRTYRSGSCDMILHARPVSFRHRQGATQLPAFDAHEGVRRRASRINEGQRKTADIQAGYGLHLSLVLREYEPAENGIEKLFKKVLEYRKDIEPRLYSS